MKNAITNMWLLSLVVIFIFIFSAYLAITVNYSKAFKVKNEILDIIEKRKGIKLDSSASTQAGIIADGDVMVPKSSLGVANVYLTASGYKTRGTCGVLTDEGTIDNSATWYGVKDLSVGPSASVGAEIAQVGKKYYWCFRKRKIGSCGNCTNSINAHDPIVYEVLLFYKFELPVLGDLFTFDVEGTTDEIYFSIDDGLKCTCT